MDSHRVIGLKAQFPAFRGRALHYFDSAATAQMPQSVVDAVNDYDIHYRANVHGEVHELACRAVTAYWDARASVARLINAASPREVVFTYGATSSINLLAASFGEMLRQGDEIVLSGATCSKSSVSCSLAGLAAGRRSTGDGRSGRTGWA